MYITKLGWNDKTGSKGYHVCMESKRTQQNKRIKRRALNSDYLVKNGAMRQKTNVLSESRTEE